MIRNRIKELRHVRAGDLKADDRNPRRHPKAQRAALEQMLQRNGYADALLTRETPDGLVLIDGHLRAELDADQVVPVLVTDLDEAEAGELLLTLDPLASMAEADTQALTELANSMPDDEDFRELLTGIHDADLGQVLTESFVGIDMSQVPRLDERTRIKCPECGHEFKPT